MLRVGIPITKIVQSRFGKSIYLCDSINATRTEIKRECKTCHEILDIEEFYPKSNKEPHIRRRECKSCWKKYKAYEWAKENPEAWRDAQYKYLRSEKGKEKAKIAHKKRMKNPPYKIAITLRNRTSKAFGAAKKHGFNGMKNRRTLNLLGAQSW